MFYYSQQINFTTMKKSLSALKEKFGKFEISKEQTKKVIGGTTLTCETADGRIIGRGTPERALRICAGNPACIGCF